MSATVVGLRGVLPDGVGKEPCVDVVEVLEEALNDAKNGRVRGVAVALVLQDGCISTAYDAGDVNRHMLISAAAHLSARMLAEHAA